MVDEDSSEQTEVTPDDARAQALYAELRADRERWERKERRRRLIAFALLPGYIFAGVAIALGIDDVIDAGMTSTAGWLIAGFATLFTLSWICPVITQRFVNKPPREDRSRALGTDSAAPEKGPS